ncbi:MAG: amidohydrolase family protein, partial [Chloroflexi bacterium]|nr:amidohydrolase family protein [Chloroflexota bacterium]
MQDILIKNATVVTVNEKNDIIKNGGIVIEGGKIKDLGSVEELAKKYRVRDEIDASGMIAMPGLINGHVHTITSLYKGAMTGFGFEKTMGEDTVLAFNSTPNIMLAASRLAASEMLLSGTTTANVATDAMTFEVSRQTAEALGQAGMRGFVQTAIADILGPTNFRVDAQLAEAAKLLDEYRDKFDGRI